MNKICNALKFIALPFLLATANSLAVAQQPANVLSLNGTTQYVSVADNNALDLTNNFTVEAWIKPNSFNALAGIVSKYNSASSNGYNLTLSGSSLYSGINFCGQTTANGLLTTGKWYHVAGVVNAKQVTIYIDGVAVKTGAVGTLAANSDAMTIGRDYSPSPRYFNGNIDEVRIWNDVRTQAEIQAGMFTELTPANEANLVAYYKCNDGSGSTLTDSKNGHNGTTVASPTWTTSYQWMGGTYTVNPSGTGNTNFTTFAASVSAINGAKVTSPVSFNVKDDATFTETATQIITTTGTDSNTITYQRSQDGTNKPKLQFSGTSGGSDVCIQLNSSDYMTFDGLEIQPNGTNTNTFVEYGIFFNGAGATDGCQHNTVKNCDIKFGGGGTTNTALTSGILLANSATAAAGANSYNSFLKINIDKATRGYQIIGTSGFPDIDNTIGTNTGLSNISDIGYGDYASETYGVEYQYQTNIVISYQVMTFRSAAITAATGRVLGIHSTGGTTVNTASIHHNTISGITVNKTDNSLSVKLIQLEANLSASIYNNTLQNIDNQNTNSDGVWGIYIGQGASSIYNNTITGLNNNSIAGNKGRVIGIETSGTTTRIYNNKIYNLKYVNSSNTTQANVIGILGWMSTSDTIYNNMIYQLYAPAVHGRAISGIELSANTVNASVVFNTVYLDNTSTNAGNQSACLYMANTGTLDLRNNIFINKSDMTTGTRAVAFYKNTSGVPNLATTSNNNLFYAGTPGTKNLIFYNGTDYQTLDAYQGLWSSSPKREQTSVTEANTPFQGTSGAIYNLSMNPAVSTIAAGAGSPINSIPTDIDGNTRSSTNPDLGASEFYQPAIVVSPVTLTLDPVNSGSVSASQIFTLRGSDLTENVTITAPAHFQISFDDLTYTATSLTKTITNGATGTTYVYVKFAPTTTGAKSGNVTFTANSVTSNGAVTGTALDPNCTGPSTTAGNLTFKNVTHNSIQVGGLSSATGATGYVVYVNKTNSFTVPASGATPAINSVWANTGQQAIYMGNMPYNAVVTGLSASTTWYFKVYAYKLCNGGNYYESTGIGGSVATIGNPIYVKYNATGSNNGTSWANAYLSLQSALDAATVGKQIWVAKGTYYPSKDNTGSSTPENNRFKTFFINKKLFIYGGFAGTESNVAQRVNFGYTQTNETILSGNIGVIYIVSDNSYNVVSITGKAGDVSIDGFTVMDGYANDFTVNGITDRGAGLNFDAASYYAYGSSNPSISNCYFRNNTATINGGSAIYIASAGTGVITGGSFTNCTLEGNTGGSALFVLNSQTAAIQTNFTNLKVIGNNGGGIKLFSAVGFDQMTSNFINCQISGNLMTGSNPVVELSNFGTVNFINCLITANRNDYGCAGLEISDGEPKIINSVIWNNSNGYSTGGKFTNFTVDSYFTAFNSLIQSWTLGGTNLNGITYASNANYPRFTTNIDMATAIIPTKAGDFHLLDNSPVIDAGSVLYTTTFYSDLDGEARVQNGGLDLGPYEGGIICIVPVIKTQPVASTKFEGQSATFDCGATGTGLTYQWLLNGTNITGATSASYTKTELVKADAGSYSCLVTGTCGEATSDGAMLTVNAACVNPVITIQPLGGTKKVSESITFTLVATGTNLKYSWSQGGGATRISGATNASYTIKSVGMHHAGTYYCYVTNDCNTEAVSSGAVLKVIKADQIIRFATLATRSYGDANFNPDAIASAYPITLVSSNTNVATIVNNQIHIVGVGTCTITASQAGDENFNAAPDASQLLTVVKGTAVLTLGNLVQAYDGSAKSVTVTSVPNSLTTIGVTYDGSSTAPSAIGSYAVIATLTNDHYEGTVSGTLQITCKPVVANALQSDYYITEGKPFTITVNAVGTPTLVYQWKKGATNIGTNSATFTIDNISTFDIGDYTCNISNACGNITTNAATLHVQLEVPLSATATPATIFTGSSSDLTAISTGNQIRWYNAPVEGTLLGTSESGANFPVTPAENTTWYAEAYNSGTNITPSGTRVPVTVNVVPPNAIVINTYQTFGGSIGTDLVSKYGQAFTTDNQPRVLKSAEFSFWTDGAGGGNAVVQLYSSNPDGTINTLISTLEGSYGRTFINNSANPSEIWSFAPPTPVTLSASTTYWLVIYSNFEAGAGQCDLDFTLSTDYNGIGTMPLTKNSSSWEVGTPSHWAYYTLADNPFKFAVYANLIGEGAWTGAIDTEWNKAGNWSNNKVPGSSDNATIPFIGITNFPIVLAGNLAVCNDLTIESGASVTISSGKVLEVHGTLTNNAGVTGLVVLSSSDASDGTGALINSTVGVSGTVERFVSGDIWHLISPSATGGETVASFVDLAHGNLVARNANNFALSPYLEATGLWDYYKVSGANTAGLFGTPAKGMQVLRASGTGTGNGTAGGSGKLAFKGTLTATNQDITITKTSSGWNLVGNPYPCAIDMDAFLAANSASIDPSYLFSYVTKVGDLTAYGYDPNMAGLKLSSGEGFFVKSLAGGETIHFTMAMKSLTSDGYKSATVGSPTIQLTVEDGYEKLYTTIQYVQGATTGLDPGKDAGLFKDGLLYFSLFTRLIQDNGVDFTVQSLPDNNYDSMVVPVGVVADKGSNLTFKATTLNFPANYKATLEDKATGTFTSLSDVGSSYAVALDTKLSGTGRFYLHMNGIVSAVGDLALQGKLTAYAVRDVEVRVTGEVGDNAIATLYNGLGQVVLVKKLGAGSLNIIGLPNLNSGVYLLKINDKGTTQTIKVLVRK